MDSSFVTNVNSDRYGEYIPESDHSYVGWYGFIFSYEGEGWVSNPLYSYGYGERTVWGDDSYKSPGAVIGCICVNLALVSLPFVLDFFRKSSCKNTAVNFREDRIFGSRGLGLIKKKYDIPFESVNSVTVINSKEDSFIIWLLDKFRTGKSIKIIYNAQAAVFSFIQNPNEAKDFIEGQISGFRSGKVAEADNGSMIKTASVTENLVKLQELLDAGIITQEEFDSKKEQILNPKI